MNWSKYAERKGKSADFKSKERVLQPAILEEKDKDGKVVQEAVEEKKESYIVLVQKRWNSESGEPLFDSEREYRLKDLESEKARYDDDIAKAKEQSDGLKKAIADFKKIK
tara:strand:+ start:327 stop:656 length:330 start_codon:yes stop_codon:yes gene_type:complete